MIHDEGFEQGCAHFREVFVVPGLRSEKRAFQQARISNTRFTAKTFDQPRMYLEQFVMGEELYRISGQAVVPVLRFGPSSLRGDSILPV